MLKPVIQAFQLFLKGASGKDRQAKHQLSEHLLQIQVAYDQLQQNHDRLQQERDQFQQGHRSLKKENSRFQQEQARLQQQTTDLRERLQRSKSDLDELINVADSDAELLTAENQDLQKRLQHSETEKERLQTANGQLVGEIAVLKQQIELLGYQNQGDYSKEPLSNRAEPVLPPFGHDSVGIPQALVTEASSSYFDEVDLSGLSLALIGGHETTYREVKSELKRYGLKRCIHIPPHSIATHSRNQIKDKICHCDLVVTITSYVDHSVSKCVKQLNDAQLLAGNCIRVSCHGKSGLIREVLEYFDESLNRSEAV